MLSYNKYNNNNNYFKVRMLLPGVCVRRIQPYTASNNDKSINLNFVLNWKTN